MIKTRLAIVMVGLVLVSGCTSPAARRGAARPRDPERSRQHLVQGNELVRKGQLDKAAVQFEKALDADVYNGQAFNNLGLVYFHQGNLYQAAWHFRYAMRLLPHQPEPRNNLGLVFDTAGQTDEAIANFDEALRLEPDNPQLLGNLLRARLRRGDSGPEVRQQLKELILREKRPAWREWAHRKIALMGNADTAEVPDELDAVDPP